MIGALLCAIGHHAPEPEGLWNGGYCFTRCARCGRDMVRSAFGEWHVPRDHRIAWHPPGNGRAHAVQPHARAPESAPPEREAAPVAGPRPRAPPTRTARPNDPFDFGEFDRLPDTDGGHTPGLRAMR